MARRGGAAGPQRHPTRRKALGQHHLRDGALAAPLVEFLRLAPGVPVLEIGPGGGALTRELRARGAHVVALELDLEWAVELARGAHGGGSRQRLSEKENAVRSQSGLVVAVGDALEVDWSRISPRWRVAGNLPYNVGTAILERFLRGAPAGVRAGFLLQREVVERLVATPGSPAYGALSVLVASRARARQLAVVKPGSFVPPPRVESAFVGVETVTPPVDPALLVALERVVRAAFAQRRKSLRNALAAGAGREAAERALAAAGLARGRRAETLSLEEFVALARAFDESTSG